MDATNAATESDTRNDDGRVVLDAFEIRVLAVLGEKESLTPDNYPMSINALTNGCNQLSSRDPVMSISESTVLDTLHALMQKKFIVEVSQAGGRVPKYEHRMRVKWSLEQDKLAVLLIMMLRGSQTAGEIRTRSGRLHDFASVTDVETCLQFLMDKYPPLVARLARAPGTKEPRYAQLLAGEEALEREETAAGYGSSVAQDRPRQDRIGELESEVARLRGDIDSLTLQFAEFKKQFE